MIRFPVVEDSLAAVAYEGRDLLWRAELVIDQMGVPGDHDLAALMRKVRTGPAQAFDTLLELSPEPMLDAAAALRALAAGHRDELVEPLVRALPELDWVGEGAEGFAMRLTRQVSDIAGDSEDSLVSRLTAAADVAASVAGWLSRARRAMAFVVAEALGSREAVTLKRCDLPDSGADGLPGSGIGHAGLADAAANVGAAVLSVVEEWHAAAVDGFV